MGCWRVWLLLLVFMCCCATISSHGDHHHCGHEHHHEHQHEHHHDAGEQQSPAQHGAHHAHQHSAEQFRRLPEELAEEEELAGHGFLYGEARQPQAQEPQAAAVWLTALGCALLVSTASLICLLLLPFILKDGKPSAAVVDALAGFGAGAMLGDALLHQLPHAFSSSGHSHDHGHDHEHHGHGSHGGHGHSIQDLSIGLSVLAGILVFFIVEKLVRYVEEASAQAGISSSHSHHHHRHASSAGDGKADADGSDAQQVKKGKKVQTQGKAESKDAPGWVLAYLNLFSDGVHNFTDGMALGSAFLLHGGVGGWSRTLFLLAHELPQEVGDFGILVRSGLSVSKALALNFLSALAAVAGTALALVLGGNPGHSSFVEAFTAGGFIYISLAGVIPGMHDQGSSPKTSLRQLASLSLGVGVAIAISLAE